MQIKVFSDGGARGNPGPAGVGAVICCGEKKHEISKFIGVTTNNQAEYQAVIEALSWIKENIQNSQDDSTLTIIPGMIIRVEDLEIECFLDSQLVVEQLNQRYKLKHEGLKPLFWQIRDLVMQLGGNVSFKYIPRDQNKEADKLVNKALDEAKK